MLHCDSSNLHDGSGDCLDEVPLRFHGVIDKGWPLLLEESVYCLHQAFIVTEEFELSVLASFVVQQDMMEVQEDTEHAICLCPVG